MNIASSQLNREIETIRSVANKTLARVLQGSADANLKFEDLRTLLRWLGFSERIKGGHHIFTKPGVAEILNLQARGADAKVSGQASSQCD